MSDCEILQLTQEAVHADDAAVLVAVDRGHSVKPKTSFFVQPKIVKVVRGRGVPGFHVNLSLHSDDFGHDPACTLEHLLVVPLSVYLEEAAICRRGEDIVQSPNFHGLVI